MRRAGPLVSRLPSATRQRHYSSGSSTDRQHYPWSKMPFLAHAGLGLTTPGVATPGRAAPSSCFLCLRERCFGPATITTAIATTHHTTASNHDCLTESAPENIGEKKLPEMVLFMACISMTISTLPLALLNTQVNTTDTAMTSTRSDQLTSPTTISGRCQKAQSTPRIRLATSAERPDCRRGRA